MKKMLIFIVLSLLLFGIADAKTLRDVGNRNNNNLMTGEIVRINYEYSDSDHKEEDVFFGDDGSEYTLSLSRGLTMPSSGSLVGLEGIRKGKEIVVDGFWSLRERNVLGNAGGYSGESGSLRTEKYKQIGEQKTAVVLLNFSNGNFVGETLKEIDARVFSEARGNSINSYLKEVSYGKTFLSGKVFGWYQTQEEANSQSCTTGNLLKKAISLSDGEIDFGKYSRLIVITSGGCSYGGASFEGGKRVITNEGNFTYGVLFLNSLNNINNGVGVHEFGHTLGLSHSNYYQCGAKPMGDYNECNSIQYEDMFDVMGWPSLTGHFNSIYKKQLGWFDGNNILENPASGEYRIYPIEKKGERIKTIVLDSSFGFKYYIEYRRSVGFDSFALQHGSDLYDGAMIRVNVNSGGGRSQLIDMRPDSNMKDVVLRKGETFDDKLSRLKITTSDFNEDYLTILVEKY